MDRADYAMRNLRTMNDVVAEFDRRMKGRVDEILYAVEKMSARLCQMEGRTLSLENSVDDLKEDAEFYHCLTDRKLGQLQNILMEVQDDVRILRDNQEIAEARFHLEKLQVSRSELQLKSQNSTGNTDLLQVQQTSSSFAPQQFHQLNTISINSISPPRPPPQSPYLESSYFHLSPEFTYKQCNMPTIQQHEIYLSGPQLSQLPRPHQEQSTFSNTPALSLPSHHPSYYSSRYSSDFSTAYSPSGPANKFHKPHNGSSSPYIEAGVGLAGQKIPYALPIASSVEGRSSSTETGNSSSVDDVVDKVTAMGFVRGVVRAAARKLMENGQSVDLNVLLDKLMNNEGNSQT